MICIKSELLYRKNGPAELLISDSDLSWLAQQSCWPLQERISTCRMSTRALPACIQNKKKAGAHTGRESRMLWTVFAILLLLWLLGWGFHVAGSLIHLILVIALVVLVIELITGRRATV